VLHIFSWNSITSRARTFRLDHDRTVMIDAKGGRSRWSDVAISASTNLVGTSGSFLVMTALVLALQQRGATGIEVTALLLCEAVPMVVFGKLLGAAVDRFDSRILLVIGGSAQVVACLALSRATSLPAVLGGAFSLSVATGLVASTRQALFPAMVTRDDLPRALAIGQTAASVGMMLGPAGAGFLVGGLGVNRTTTAAAAAFVATIVAGLALRTRHGRVHRPADGLAEVAAWSLRSDRLLWTSVWSLTAVVAALAAVNVALVFFILETLRGTQAQYGLVESLYTVGVMAGAWVFGRLVRPTTTDVAVAGRLIAGLGLVSASLMATGSVRTAVWIAPCYLLGGIGNGGLNNMTATLFGRRVPPAARGRAGTAMTMRVQGGAMVGMLAGGGLLSLVDPRWIVLGCGILGLAVVGGLAPRVRDAAPPVPAPDQAAPTNALKSEREESPIRSGSSRAEALTTGTATRSL
jgi:MFS family permease